MILAIRTDSERAELYVLDKEGKQLNSEIWQSGRELSQQILQKIADLLKRNKNDFENLTGIVVFQGPGSFTSLRIGISVGNALAYGLEIPVVGTDGKAWLAAGFKNLQNAKAGEFVMPEYGAEPNITKPRK